MPKRIKAGTQTDMYAPIYIAVLFTIAKSGNNTSIHPQMSEQTKQGIHNGILFILIKEGHSDTGYLDEP